MKEKLVHRGPDAQGSFVNDSVALGFRRLSIIDLEGGLQPMKSISQNLTVVFNGEIYNYQELREQMEREKKILFVTRSDTETLVNGLEAYGPAFVEQLRGMFAFAVWNEKKEELMLARDFFGIKPLFYTVVDGNFVFASEIKSILQFPGVPKKLNERALEQYLSFQYSVLEETFFEGIYRLPPGCMLFYRQGKYEICRYFQPKLQPEAGCSLADMEKKLESVLKKSVRRHMVSDVEVGTFLSGGVDSGFIAVLSGAKMAFTVGFLDGNSGYNEENRAREVARYAHLSYHMHTIGKKEFWDVLPKVMYALDEPSGDASAVAMYFLAAKASEVGVQKTESGLLYVVERQGTGEKPTLNDRVKVHYTGKLINGKKFDSSYDRQQPLELSVGGVIAGWQEGLQLMPVGSKYIPSELGYGERGAGKDIPANSALIFEVELLEIIR